jgi:hypothetical protein
MREHNMNVPVHQRRPCRCFSHSPRTPDGTRGAWESNSALRSGNIEASFVSRAESSRIYSASAIAGTVYRKLPPPPDPARTDRRAKDSSATIDRRRECRDHRA